MNVSKFILILFLTSIVIPFGYSQNIDQSIFIDLADGYAGNNCLYTAKYQEETYYTAYEEARLFEVIEVEYIKEMKTFSIEELLYYKISDSLYRIPSADTLQNVSFKRKVESSILAPYENGVMFCIVNVHPHSDIYSLKELERLNYTIPYIRLKEVAKILVTEVSEKPINVSQNQIYLPRGIYSPFVIAVAGGDAHGAFVFYKIRNRLKELGYDVEDEDWKLEKTSKALEDFCEKNNIPKVFDQKLADALEIE
jgi:hypothetical protein